MALGLDGRRSGLRTIPCGPKSAGRSLVACGPQQCHWHDLGFDESGCCRENRGQKG